MKLALLFAVLLVNTTVHADDHSAIGKVIDDFHDAAAEADMDRYLGHMTDDGVFMGTDEWERWPLRPDFTEYVTGRFANGGWNYRSVERHIRIADSADTAWFDEVVFSESNGRFRGTGVLSKQDDGTWKIAHYAMSFLILNENWEEVVELTKKTNAGLAVQ